MKTVTISSFADFHSVVRTFLNNRLVMFRGHNDVDWLLVPKSGRKEYHGTDQKKMFASFCRRASEFLQVEPKNGWDWFAVAQHHGLPTPLLDWSYNPLVAAYFSVFPFEDKDCAIYAYYTEKPIDTEKQSPDSFQGVGRVVPRGIAQRIVRQSGNFTYHNPYDRPLEASIGDRDLFVKIIIKKHYRREMIYELDKYGVNKMTLFPDLDGLCGYMAWTGRNDVRSFWTDFGKT